MIFFKKFFGNKSRMYQESGRILKSLIKEGNIDFQKIDVEALFDLYQKFTDYTFQCYEEAFLFQCGCFDFAGKELFYWDLVRQFILAEHAEDENIKQLHLEIRFTPTAELQKIKFNKWSYDFPTVKTFIKYLETEKQVLSIEGLRAIDHRIYIDNI